MTAAASSVQSPRTIGRALFDDIQKLKSLAFAIDYDSEQCTKLFDSIVPRIMQQPVDHIFLDVLLEKLKFSVTSMPKHWCDEKIDVCQAGIRIKELDPSNVLVNFFGASKAHLMSCKESHTTCSKCKEIF